MNWLSSGIGMLSFIETNREVVIRIDSELRVRYNSEGTCYVLIVKFG